MTNCLRQYVDVHYGVSFRFSFGLLAPFATNTVPKNRSGMQTHKVPSKMELPKVMTSEDKNISRLLTTRTVPQIRW